ncbi:MAG TPA: phospholipase D-like domain-containing protein [Candidatus Saccharimonadales bacterium]
MFSLTKPRTDLTSMLDSRLFDESTFYDAFLKDLKKCHSEVIIESPFVTNRRVTQLLGVLEKLKERKVRVAINTRDPEEHDSEYMREEARRALSSLQRKGIHILFTESHHRKLAVIDRSIVYEGSLNILSQNDSCEVMRRIESVQLAWQMIRFVKIDQYLQ